jgi:homoserine dehydrogenase
MKSEVTLGLIGLGTVGNKVFELITANKQAIEQKIGARLEFVYCCDKDPGRINKLKPKTGNKCVMTHDWQKIVTDPLVDIVIELIGGKELAYKVIMESIKNGKHVVTANKAVLSENWHEIFTKSQFNQKLVYFEAAVCAGIPIIQALNEGLAANKIDKIVGILNGTTNYILTKMLENQIDFSTALKQAQQAGFAEKDPTLDITGSDTAHKLSILSSIAWSDGIKLNNIYTEGIQNIDIIDIMYAYEQFGYLIKLLAVAKETDNKLSLEVRPHMISGSHPFAMVKNEFNGVLINGSACGEMIFYGKGAGGYPAASAVVSDVMFLARQVAIGTAGRIPFVSYEPSKPTKFIDIDQTEGKYYLRFITADKPGVLAQISSILAKNSVSIASVYQKESPYLKTGVPIILLTHSVKEKCIRKSINQIDKLNIIKSKTVCTKILD